MGPGFESRPPHHIYNNSRTSSLLLSYGQTASIAFISNSTGWITFQLSLAMTVASSQSVVAANRGSGAVEWQGCTSFFEVDPSIRPAPTVRSCVNDRITGPATLVLAPSPAARSDRRVALGLLVIRGSQQLSADERYLAQSFWLSPTRARRTGPDLVRSEQGFLRERAASLGRGRGDFTECVF